VSLLDSAKKEVERIVTETVPEGKRAALVFVATERGGEFLTVAKLGDHWLAQAAVRTEWRKLSDVTGEVRIVGAW
jgi:hypothetical protein